MSVENTVAADEGRPVQKLTKDILAKMLKKGGDMPDGGGISRDEARFLVDLYYSAQGFRLSSANQVRALLKDQEPHAVLAWSMQQFETLEKQIARALDVYTSEGDLNTWARSIIGIGPVLTAGLAAHIDIARVNSPAQIWSFAGLDPTKSWEKGEKRPWNASLKVLCWKIGESFVKVSGNENSTYGRWYAERKKYEIARNERGENKGAAEAKLAKFNIGKSTDAYKAYSTGILPDAHVHARAKRWTVKMFLSHYFEAGYYYLHGKEAPRPWVIEFGGHKDHIKWTEAS